MLCLLKYSIIQTVEWLLLLTFPLGVARHTLTLYCSLPSTCSSVCPKVPCSYKAPLTPRAALRRILFSFFYSLFSQILGHQVVRALVNKKKKIKSHVPVLWLIISKNGMNKCDHFRLFWVLCSQVFLEPHRPGLEFWWNPSLPVWSQQLLNFLKSMFSL